LIKDKFDDADIQLWVRQRKLRFETEDIGAVRQCGASKELQRWLLLGGEGVASAPADPVVNPTAAVGGVYGSLTVDLSSIKCQAPPETRKRVLAVKEFDFGAVKSKEQAAFNTEVAVGKGMAALAIKRIAEAKKFRVVDRAMLNETLHEQDKASSDRIKEGTGPRRGRVIGADALVLGTITIFGPDDKKSALSTIVNKLPGPLGRVGGHKTTNKWVVGVTYQLVDAETSEIIGQGDARATAERKSKGVDIGAVLGSGAAGTNIDMTSQNFLETVIGEATLNAVDQLIAKMNADEQKIPLHFLESSSRIADVSPGKLTISAGSSNGVLPCDRLVISRVIKEIKDPVTGEVLDLQLRKIGEMLATDLKEKIASGSFQGMEEPKVGDVAEKIKPQASAARSDTAENK
jgi:curli biogenesis system outer membrane secretion channel CsgG